MMIDTEHDPYAFPGDRYSSRGHKTGHGQGMTMRDWCAGQALPWALSQLGCDTPYGFCHSPEILAYAIADAMIAERTKAML